MRATVAIVDSGMLALAPPVSIDSVVVFPAPFTPRNPKHSADLICRWRSTRATFGAARPRAARQAGDRLHKFAESDALQKDLAASHTAYAAAVEKVVSGLAQTLDELRRLRDQVEGVQVHPDVARYLVDVVGRTVRITGGEIERLERVIRSVAPTAVHIDLELI